MDLNEIMATLASMGTAQNQKIYKRHGAGENVFGVSFANLRKLQKKLKHNTALARELWQTGNTDARTLAIMIADPWEFTEKDADQWIDDIEQQRYYLLADLLAGLIARTTFAQTKMWEWMADTREYYSQTGWDILANLLKNGASLSKQECLNYLKIIEATIHVQKNRTRHAMNNALIALGIYRSDIRAQVIESSRRIGKVIVDHGETNCKTPDAITYINRAINRPQRQRKRKTPLKSQST